MLFFLVGWVIKELWFCPGSPMFCQCFEGELLQQCLSLIFGQEGILLSIIGTDLGRFFLVAVRRLIVLPSARPAIFVGSYVIVKPSCLFGKPQ